MIQDTEESVNLYKLRYYQNRLRKLYPGVRALGIALSEDGMIDFFQTSHTEHTDWDF